MPSFHTQTLLTELEAEINQLIVRASQRFGNLPDAQLTQQPSHDRWSIAQCLEHLNSYGQYYIPLLTQVIALGEQQDKAASPEFRSSWLGNYFAEMMRPKADGRIAMPMKAFKNHTPAAQLNVPLVLAEFFDQQQQLLSLLQRARAVDMSRLKVPISIARWIKLSVGDTFRFLIAHEQRHVTQAERVADGLPKTRILGTKTPV
ncbi:DinB family protein [Spirosoma knui]